MNWLSGYAWGLMVGVLAVGSAWRIVTILKQPKRDARGRYAKRGL